MTDSSNAARFFEPAIERTMAMRRALVRLARPETRITSLAFLGAGEIAGLRDWAREQDYRQATPVIEHRGRKVHQDFEVCFPAPRTGAFDSLAGLLERSMDSAFRDLESSPFEGGVTLNDFAIQRYPAGSSGIGIHRDGRRYHSIVVIVTLEGDSRLFTCDDRQGRARRRIDDSPGRIVLLSAERFASRSGEHARPLHGVDRIAGGRLSLGMRCVEASSS